MSEATKDVGTRHLGNKEDPPQVGIWLFYDWRTFRPMAYNAHPAVHNTGNTLLESGTKYGFTSMQKIGENTYREFRHFQQLPNNLFLPVSAEGIFLVNFHQPALVVDRVITNQPTTQEITTVTRWLPWRKHKQTRIVYKEKEDLIPIRVLTAAEILKNTESAEPVRISELEIGLPQSFLAELPIDLSKTVNRLMTVIYFIPQNQDQQLEQKPILETKEYFTQILSHLLRERGGDQRKVDEFISWTKTTPVQRYDYESGQLINVPS